MQISILLKPGFLLKVDIVLVFQFFPGLMGFPCGLASKESTCHAGDLGSIPGFGRSPGEEKGYPLQYSGLENSMDCIVQGVKLIQLYSFPGGS